MNTRMLMHELVRRRDCKSLVSRSKRTQARSKLATLPAPEFEDLCVDVYFEIMRRYQFTMEDSEDTHASSQETEGIVPDGLRAADYEFKIAAMQSHITSLEQDLEQCQQTVRRLEEDNSELIKLRADMEGLMSELSDLSRRNDEFIAKDLKEHELRSVKGQQRYVYQDQHIRVTAFVSAIDSLLAAGRFSAPTSVLVPMKVVVMSTTAIIDDVRAYEQRPSRTVDVETLRERAEATLTNLVAASKTHATASGMSPVSLLDAAASHVSVTVTEIAKIIYSGRTEDTLSYLEAQSIIHAVRGVIFGLRTLNENLTLVITIVSRIVDVCDNLPPASAQQGAELLRELGEHARKLSEATEVTKESRKVMVKSSFAVAQAMRSLMKLFEV